jgi:hypothetical protein
MPRRVRGVCRFAHRAAGARVFGEASRRTYWREQSSEDYSRFAETTNACGGVAIACRRLSLTERASWVRESAR